MVRTGEEGSVMAKLVSNAREPVKRRSASCSYRELTQVPLAERLRRVGEFELREFGKLAP
jgi:hypothetical protein